MNNIFRISDCLLVKLITALFISGFIPCVLYGQINDTSLITWSEEYKLNYDDFNGKPGRDAEVALTSSGISFLYEYDGREKITVTILCIFDKSKSWFREEGKVAEVLSHEQTHFDITELNVRLLRKALSEKTFRKGNNFDVMLPRLYNEQVAKCRQMQNEYDIQTNHGINTTQQAGWEKKVANQLNALKQFQQAEIQFKVN